MAMKVNETEDTEDGALQHLQLGRHQRHCQAAMELGLQDRIVVDTATTARILQTHQIPMSILVTLSWTERRETRKLLVL